MLSSQCCYVYHHDQWALWRRRTRKGKLFFIRYGGKGCFPNVITFNTLLHGFIQNNETPKAVVLLHKMAKRNVIPDATTFSIVIDLLGMEENWSECLNSLPSFPVQELTKS
ncbi:hypothetical protein Dsin_030064 [Dipteronia sinensis]|uniref:Pentatricopeptide repeat-containing protein n=1 Tax=Dipteronia sinensis TaxID=43782 RepID=A0AAE0DQP0_9ROSI|nr:hypothetical protein Dsin_030064 [Dipteronia sinensis]